MKIYIIEASKGSYDDYCEWVDSVWIDPVKARSYLELMNKQITEAKGSVEPEDVWEKYHPETPPDEVLKEYYEKWNKWNEAAEMHESILNEYETKD